MNPSEGRVPVSWDEVADWLDAGGVVEYWPPVGEPSQTYHGADFFRRGGILPLERYRLLPPPRLVAAPEGMDGGGWLGEGRHVPEGWLWRSDPSCISWFSWADYRPDPGRIVQCRPPVRERAVVEVPLTRLVGRTIEGCEKPVESGPWNSPSGWRWWDGIGPDWHPFPDGTLDLDTGRVRVYAEGGEK